MAEKTTSQKQSKSDFIRSLPASMPAAEVVTKAKAAGVTIRAGLVYEVRRASKAKKKAAKKASTAAGATSKKSAATKADFVRAHADLSPKEVVAKGKAEGVKLNTGYVHNVRAYDKTKGEKKATKQAARRATTRTAPAIHRPIANTSSAEDLLRALGAELGLARAIEILQGERARVHAVLRG